MTEDQVQLVRSSYQRIRPRLANLSLQFYQRLFELEPKLRRLFQKADMNEQRRKFISVLSILVASAHETKTLHGILAELASRHVKYGVKPTDFDVLGAALIWALDQELGSAFTPDTRQAWAQLYEELATIMRASLVRGDDLDSTMPLHVSQGNLVRRSAKKSAPQSNSWVARIRSFLPSGS